MEEPKFQTLLENQTQLKKIIKLPELHKNQQIVADDESRWKILCAGRRFGKTRLGVQLCIETAMQGKRAWWVAPTFSIARVGWRDIMMAGFDLADSLGVEVKMGDMVVNFPNGGFISVKSADNPQRLRGEGLDFLVMDEAAFVKEETWTEVLRPTLTERKGSALFISTPRGMNNWFYRLWQDADEREDWSKFKFSTVDNPEIDPEELESAKREIGSLTFAQEYEAEFVNEGTQLFKQEWFRYYQPAVRGAKLDGILYEFDNMSRFATVDLATSTKQTADYTVFTAFAHDTSENKLFVTDMLRKRMEAPDIIPSMKKFYKKNNLDWIGIEKAGFQLSIIQFARREGIQVRELRADRDKRSRAMPLSAKMESGQVFFPDDPMENWVHEAERELLTFPLGTHDDIVDTLAYGVLNLNKRRSWKAY
jgi:predicted phage terminase large subunit-like protein